MKKRLTSVLLVLAMVLSMVPAFTVSVCAAPAEPAGRDTDWDILYSEIVAKGSFYAYEAGTRVYFDMLPQLYYPSDDDSKYAVFSTYDYAVDRRLVEGVQDDSYISLHHQEEIAINQIFELPQTFCNDQLQSGGFWVLKIWDNGKAEFFAVQSSGNGNSITVDPQTKSVPRIYVFTNYTDTKTDDIYFTKKITNDADLMELFTQGGYGYLENDITVAIPILPASWVEGVNLFLDGKTINLNGSFIKVEPGVTFNLYDNGTTGAIINGNNEFIGYGGAFYLEGEKTLDINKYSILNMYGGTIRDCKAVYGGAVAVLTNGAFHMHGGAITGNRAQENGGGVYNGDNATFDGKCIIDDNHIGLGDKETEENVYTGQFRLYTDDQIAVGLTEGSKVGITYMYGKGQITEEYSNPAFDQAKQTDYFFSDNPKYCVAYNPGTGLGGYLELTDIKVLATTDGVTTGYSSIEAALKHGKASTSDVPAGESPASPTAIKLLVDIAENVEIPAGRNITLDLNGFVLKAAAGGSVIVNKGTLTINDSDPGSRARNYKVGANGLWTLTDEEYTKIYDKLTELPSVNDIIQIFGGSITAGNSPYGGGIRNNGTLVIESGNIIGNSASLQGGAIRNDNILEMNGGRIIGCSAPVAGGVLNVSGANRFDFNDGSIAYCAAADSDKGQGGGVYTLSKFNMTGGMILGCSAKNGGGVFVAEGSSQKGQFNMSGGSITQCIAANNGGGVDNYAGTNVKFGFIMTGGKISECKAVYGAGIFANGTNGGITTYTKLAGGSITENTAQKRGGGALFGLYSSTTLGGDIKVNNNNSTRDGVSNLMTLKRMKLDSLSNAKIGVALYDNGVTIGAFTTNATDTDIRYFSSDEASFDVKYEEDHLSLVMPKIIFDSLGGTTYAAIISPAGTEIDLTQYVPTRDANSTFNGWYIGRTKLADTYTLTDNATLTAHWLVDQTSTTSGSIVDNRFNQADTWTKVLVLGNTGVQACGLEAVAANEKALATDTNIKLVLTVEDADEASVPATEVTAIKTSAGGVTIKLLDIDLEKYTYTSVSAVEITHVAIHDTDADNIIEVHIPFETSEKENIKIYCYHDGSVKDFVNNNTEEDGSFFISNNVIHLFTTKFVTYAIGYTVPVPVPTPAPSYDNHDYTPEKKKNVICKQDETCVYFPFPDADVKEWYHDGLHYCVEHGILKGTSETTMEPHTTFTRAMGVTMLWRLAGCPQADYIMPFEDVMEEDYFAEAVRWAAAEGVVLGTSETEFSPYDEMTREQLAAVLYRYEKHLNGGTIGSLSSQLRFKDKDEISQYALDAVAWLYKTEVIRGKDGNIFDPQGIATRAEAACMFQRYDLYLLNK